MLIKRLLFLLAAGVLGLVTACSGGSKAAQSTSGHSPAAHSNSTGHKSSGIPQNNGGDHDGDNTGGPSDGDGNV